MEENKVESLTIQESHFDNQEIDNKEEEGDLKSPVSQKIPLPLRDPYYDFLKGETERNLYRLSQCSPQGTSLTLSLSSSKLGGIERVYLNIEQKNQAFEEELIAILEKLSSLRIVTETPESVMPLALQLPNLNELIIKEGLENDQLEQNDTSLKVADFTGDLIITIPDESYDKNPFLKKTLVTVFEEMRNLGKLHKLTVREGVDLINGKIFDDFTEDL